MIFYFFELSIDSEKIPVYLFHYLVKFINYKNFLKIILINKRFNKLLKQEKYFNFVVFDKTKYDCLKLWRAMKRGYLGCINQFPN